MLYVACESWICVHRERWSNELSKWMVLLVVKRVILLSRSIHPEVLGTI
jgi:hypothetical protein